jgi:hypothetical protein
MWLITTLVCGVLLAGCASSSSSTSGPSTGSEPGSSSGASGITSQAIAACKSAVKSEKTLSANAKRKLDGVCGQVAKGNTAPLKKIQREVCEETVENAGIPSGPAREKAVAVCRTK